MGVARIYSFADAGVGSFGEGFAVYCWVGAFCEGIGGGVGIWCGNGCGESTGEEGGEEERRLGEMHCGWNDVRLKQGQGGFSVCTIS